MAATIATLTSVSSTSFLNAQNYFKFSSFALSPTHIKPKLKSFKIKAIKEKAEEIKAPSSSLSVDEVTKKYGLEAGLWKIFSSKKEEGEEKKSKGNEATELLAKYGGAYLATSISLSLISFSLCYALISAGINVQALLQTVGISTNATGEKVPLLWHMLHIKLHLL